jgi:hypothetical protein
MVCLLKVPSHEPLSTDGTVPVECKVRIVRVDPADESGAYGVAGEIEDYRFLQTARRLVTAETPREAEARGEAEGKNSPRQVLLGDIGSSGA